LSPSEYLIAGTTIIILSIIAFWPRRGLFYILKRLMRSSRRTESEDALKFIYDCEYRHNSCSLSSLAGHLNISVEKASKTAAALESSKLAKTTGGEIKLTNDGRAYALKIIRIHRLWELHLAQNTSYEEKEWHTEAEDAEHLITAEEAEKLAAKLGNPVLDPHGDPIPTAEGDIPEVSGESIAFMDIGETGRVIHLEDEPKEIYAQLIAQGLAVGKQIQIIEKNEKRIKFTADGEECVIAPILADSISVRKLTSSEEREEEFKSLAELPEGKYATVAGISNSCRGQQRRRLMDFGIVPGTRIRSELKSLGGDPTAYIVRGTKIALRTAQARQIYIKDIKE